MPCLGFWLRAGAANVKTVEEGSEFPGLPAKNGEKESGGWYSVEIARSFRAVEFFIEFSRIGGSFEDFDQGDPRQPVGFLIAVGMLKSYFTGCGYQLTESWIQFFSVRILHGFQPYGPRDWASLSASPHDD